MPLMTSSTTPGTGSSSSSSFWKEKAGARPGRVAGAGGPVRGGYSATTSNQSNFLQSCQPNWIAALYLISKVILEEADEEEGMQ